MKWIAIAAAAATLLAGAAQAADAPICLRINQIRDTKVADTRTILFHMTDGSTWKNSLPHECNGLPFNGFSYVTSLDKICSNLQMIRANQSGAVCMLGAFTPYSPPPAGQ